jgi:hypothetical protein
VDQFAFLELKERNELALFSMGHRQGYFCSLQRTGSEPEPGRKYLVFIFIDDGQAALPLRRKGTGHRK